MPTSQSHPCACSVLCCAYLQELKQGCWSQRSAALPLHGPLFQSHFVLSHCMLLSTVSSSPWLAPQPSGYLFEIHTLAPYLLGFCSTAWLTLLGKGRFHPSYITPVNKVAAPPLPAVPWASLNVPSWQALSRCRLFLPVNGQEGFASSNLPHDLCHMPR